jgi:hypothetical protein
MSLDKLLKENAAWFDTALKQRLSDKVDEKAFTFPEEQRQRRMAELKLRVEELLQRKEEAIASFDQAIAVERAELDILDRAGPVIPVQPMPQPMPEPLPDMRTPRKKREK